MPPCTQIVGMYHKILTVYDCITVDYIIAHSKITFEPSDLQRIRVKGGGRRFGMGQNHRGSGGRPQKLKNF